MPFKATKFKHYPSIPTLLQQPIGWYNNFLLLKGEMKKVNPKYTHNQSLSVYIDEYQFDGDHQTDKLNSTSRPYGIRLYLLYTYTHLQRANIS